MDTSGCPTRCEAKVGGNAECECVLKCSGDAVLNHAGGKPGLHLCAIASGAEQAEWVHAETGEPGTPLCIKEMLVEVVDAETNEPLENVQVTMFKDQSYLTPVGKPGFTDAEGAATFAIDRAVLFVWLHLDGYNALSRVFNRKEECLDYNNCRMKIALGKAQPGSVVVRPDGCYIVMDELGEYGMQATLEWGEAEVVEDLDLWVGSLDCRQDIEERYGCGLNKNALQDYYSEALMEQLKDMDPKDIACKNHFMFSQKGVRTAESRACNVKNVALEQAGRRYSSKTKKDASGKVVLKGDNPNQFAKWVFWNARYMTKLNQRVTTKITDARSFIGSKVSTVHADWPDHHIALDVDQKYGKGPETVTFENVPPGTYQIVVNMFKATAAVKEKGIEEANPRVRITIGHNAVFNCRIPESCLKGKRRLWQVADIVIQEPVKGEDGKYYTKFKLLREDLAVLNRASQPTHPGELGGVEMYHFKPDDQHWWESVNLEYWKDATTGLARHEHVAVVQGQLEDLCPSQCEPVWGELQRCVG